MRTLLLTILITLITQNNVLFGEDSSSETSEIVEQLDTINSIDVLLEGPVPHYCLPQHKDKPNVKTEFNKKRTVSSFIESCLKPLNIARPKTFEDAIKFAIDENTKPMKNSMSKYISGLYGVSTWHQDVGLFSHPMCEKEDVKLFAGKTTKKKNRLKTISTYLLKIPKIYNLKRKKYLKAVKDKRPKKEQEVLLIDLKNFYLSLMAIIAENESISTADLKGSKDRAKSISEYYGIKDYTKPSGVKFYYDKYQDNEDSKRNIGLYQFSSDPKGNIASCIKAWNDTLGKREGKCKISLPSKKETFKYLAATDQVFNAFCGVNKIVQSFSIQVNTKVFETTSRRRTHNENKKDNVLKASKDRCISIFSDSPNTYNHFGTLGFTTDNNTKTIIKSLLGQVQ
jgi:hypothetical protein